MATEDKRHTPTIHPHSTNCNYFYICTLETSSAIQSIHLSALTMNSSTFFQDCFKYSHYYETIQVNVLTSGFYTFISSNDVITYGYVYKDHFNPFNPSANLISRHRGVCSKGQFYITAAFETNVTYVLVVTTSMSNGTGNFSILASGPNIVNFKNIGKYFY